MSVSLKASSDGTQAIIQVGGVDRAVLDNAGKLTVARVEQSTAQSMVRVEGSNGYGSTNNKIGRYINVLVNQGTDITYADSATLGGSFTINTSGVYAISFQESPSTINAICGVSLNTTAPTTSVFTIPAAERLMIGQVYAGSAPVNGATTVYLSSGSVIRLHNDGTARSGITCQFTITRVS